MIFPQTYRVRTISGISLFEQLTVKVGLMFVAAPQGPLGCRTYWTLTAYTEFSTPNKRSCHICLGRNFSGCLLGLHVDQGTPVQISPGLKR